jgi:hypothetical protein
VGVGAMFLCIGHLTKSFYCGAQTVKNTIYFYGEFVVFVRVFLVKTSLQMCITIFVVVAVRAILLTKRSATLVREKVRAESTPGYKMKNKELKKNWLMKKLIKIKNYLTFFLASPFLVCHV